MRKLLLATISTMLLSVNSVSTAAKVEKDEAREVAIAFYNDYQALKLQQKVVGLPNMQQLDAISHHFIPKVHRIFYISLREQRRCSLRGRYVPWTKGDLFTSNDAGFDTFQVDTTIPNQYGRQATVHMTLNLSGRVVTWEDEVIIRKEGGKWMIYDIEYSAASAKRGSSLLSVIDKNPAC